MLIDNGLLKLYAAPSQFTWMTFRSRSQTKKFCIKILVKVFRSLYLLNMLMDQVDTLHVDRYWSQVLCCTIMTHLDDLEVKVMDLDILC